MHAAAALLLTVALALAAGPAPAQNRSEAERKLATVKRELGAVAAERRRLEGERGAAARELRSADEQVGATSRELHDTEQRLQRDRAALAELQQRRAAMQATLGDRRAELERLLRAAYTQGQDAPLKLLLAPDRTAERQRLLAYHRALQRERAQRIATLGAELRAVDTLERAILERRSALDVARDQQRQRVAQLERDRQARAALIARLDARYADRRSREQALGRDAKALEQLLRQLRAAAARAKAERDAAARTARATKPARPGAESPRNGRASARAATAAPVQVGGLGWPLAGTLLAGYGARMPDGRRSDGYLIGAGAGASVKAVADGAVVYAEWMTGYGLLLIVDHGQNTMSLYAHNDALLKNVGERVRQGEAVATVGSSGGHGRPALYFELRRGGAPVNPASWLRR